MPQVSIKPFAFEKLKSYSHGEAQLLTRLSRLAPDLGYEPAYLEKLTEAFRKYWGSSLTIHYESLFEAPFRQFVSGLGERFVCFSVSLTPHPKKIIIEIDSDLAFTLIDKVLGGAGQFEINRPLTSLEEGVLQFVIVRLLKEVTELIPGKSPMRYERMYTSLPLLSDIENADEKMFLITFRVKVSSVEGYVRFCIPHSFLIHHESLELSGLKDQSSAFQAFLEKRFQWFDHFRTILWAEVGRVTLSVEELNQIERGDIILFDESFPQYDGQNLSGEVRLRIGDGHGGGLYAQLDESQEKIKLKIHEVFREAF